MVPIQTRAVRGLAHGPDAVVGEALGRAVVLDAAAVQDQQARAADEQASLAILADRMDVHGGMSPRPSTRCSASPSSRNRPRSVPTHSRAVSIFEDHPHEAVGEAVGGAEGAEGAVAVADQPAAFRARPQRPVAGDVSSE